MTGRRPFQAPCSKIARKVVLAALIGPGHAPPYLQHHLDELPCSPSDVVMHATRGQLGRPAPAGERRKCARSAARSACAPRLKSTAPLLQCLIQLTAYTDHNTRTHPAAPQTPLQTYESPHPPNSFGFTFRQTQGRGSRHLPHCALAATGYPSAIGRATLLQEARSHLRPGSAGGGPLGLLKFCCEPCRTAQSRSPRMATRFRSVLPPTGG